MSNKAKVADVKLGFITIEGLLLPNGEYRVAISQLVALGFVPPNRSLKQLEALLGLKFTSHLKIKSELNSKEVNTIDLKELSLVAQLCAFKGNELAQKFALAAIEETLERRFDIAFDRKRTEKEYNARLKARVEGKESRLSFTDSIKAYIERNNITGNEAKFMYKNATDKLYSCLTGYSSTKKFREKENIPSKHSPRDYASSIDLIHINEVESAAARWIYHKNIHPYEAVEYCANQLLLTKVGWNKKTRL